MKQVLIPFTTGVEELELIAVVDILRRAEISVCMASLDGNPVTGRSGIIIHADTPLADKMNQDWDLVVLPGGLPNAHLLRDNVLVKEVIIRQAAKQKQIAAICAAPTALAAYGVTAGKRITSYPSCESEMVTLQPTSSYVKDAVVQDGFLTTSRGAGTAVEFALHLVASLAGEEKSQAIRTSIVA